MRLCQEQGIDGIHVGQAQRLLEKLKFEKLKSSQAASAGDVINAINAACKTRGGHYAGYSCKIVSWDDVSRGTTVSGGLSCWGANITDTYLKAKGRAALHCAC